MSTSTKSNLWLLAHDDEPAQFEFCGGHAFAFSRTSPNKTSVNEDAAAVVELSPEHGVFVVADGMGGASSGDRAAKCIVETLIHHLESSDFAGDSARSQILDAIEEANREVLGWGIGAGSTVVVAEYLDRSIRTFHVGDATALVCSNRGTLKLSTIAHAPVAMAVEAGMIDEFEAIIHEDRHLINNCVGSTEMKIELGPVFEMASRDTLILGSDGLFDNLTTEEIIDVIRVGHFGRQANLLIQLARDRMQTPETLPSKPDDMTIIGFRQT
ncbi:PP2C family protein-serine/threonine phosphatase [Mariniblastus fucicola]|uniref:PPM-type phosphatase domain-containing protein n=1 Tax=Mariniblastus fucicola TaxID=980251 RepID=A0A5B9P733_9BACT|nr:protein phosphatase 2C domain-containing protein [Mariniblastus fucicola]QEG20396.1 Putative protein phosphatase 2C-type [Mariniblastus fucicola]